MRSMQIDAVARGVNQRLMSLLLQPEPLTAEEWAYVEACEDAVDELLLSEEDTCRRAYERREGRVIL